MTTLSVALIQERNHGDAAANLAVIETRVAEAAAQGAKLILLQELQHRVANSLQIIASVILQSARKSQSDETRTSLTDAHSRVMSVAALQQQLKQDWARTRGDIRVDSGVPLSWLRGRSPVMDVDKFAAKWQDSGVLYDVTDEGSVRVCLSV